MGRAWDHLLKEGCKGLHACPAALRLPALPAGALQAHERVANTAKELQALAARSDDTPSLETTLGALAAMCLDGAGSDLRCSVVCAKLALDTDVFKPR